MIIFHSLGVVKFVQTHLHIKALLRVSSKILDIAVVSISILCISESLLKFNRDIPIAITPIRAIQTSISIRVKARYFFVIFIKLLAKKKKKIL